MEATEEQKKCIPFTPESGFDLSFLTIKRVAEVAKSSSRAVKADIASLMKVLPVEERVVVLEFMAKSRKKKTKGGDSDESA